MAVDDAKRFVDRVGTDDVFRRKLGTALEPFLQAARDSGYNFSAMELQEAIRQKVGGKGKMDDPSACVASSEDV
jgi:predicted ribosomally synthesized peptide with nif11-like leader